jgi:uncharacterized protein YndB with AHSA1/START domain
MSNLIKLTIQTTVAKPAAHVWECMNNPKHIVNWNFAIEEWCCPRAENDLRVGGTLKSRMEARDGSFGFDFEGVYTAVEPFSHIAYTLGDGRTVDVRFEEKNGVTTVVETFEAETENDPEMQKAGWQMILTRFGDYAAKVAIS